MDYSIKIDAFEGPLDLLLHLIKKSNIDIYDINIDEITKQYLDYINKMEELNIDVASSYLVMAAELLEIKSKSLLPKQEIEEESDEEENTKENLIQKLIDYEKYKNMTNIFKELEKQRNDIYIKGPENRSNYTEKKLTNNENYNVDSLYQAFLEFLKRKEMVKPLTTKVAIKEYSIKERCKEIRNVLKIKKIIKFNELFDNYQKDYIVVTFLSILDMAKNEEILIKQEGNFNEITLLLKGSEQSE